MKRLTYYTLGAVLALAPTALAFYAMAALAETGMDNYQWAASCIVIFGVLITYLILMFED